MLKGKDNTWFFDEQKIAMKLWKYNYQLEVEFGVSFRGPNPSLADK